METPWFTQNHLMIYWSHRHMVLYTLIWTGLNAGCMVRKNISTESAHWLWDDPTSWETHEYWPAAANANMIGCPSDFDRPIAILSAGMGLIQRGPPLIEVVNHVKNITTTFLSHWDIYWIFRAILGVHQPFRGLISAFLSRLINSTLFVWTVENTYELQMLRYTWIQPACKAKYAWNIINLLQNISDI